MWHVLVSFACQETSYRELALHRDLAKNPVMKILFGDLAKRPPHRDLANRALLEILYRDFAKRPPIQILYRDLVKRAEVFLGDDL